MRADNTCYFSLAQRGWVSAYVFTYLLFSLGSSGWVCAVIINCLPADNMLRVVFASQRPQFYPNFHAAMTKIWFDETQPNGKYRLYASNQTIAQLQEKVKPHLHSSYYDVLKRLSW